VGLERGPLRLVSTIEELLERKSNGSCLESREYAALTTRHSSIPSLLGNVSVNTFPRQQIHATEEPFFFSLVLNPIFTVERFVSYAALGIS
jgi:hypothetical protein